MITKVKIIDPLFDDAPSFARSVSGGDLFQVIVYDATDEFEQVGFGIESQHDENCTFMFEMGKKDALFFAKSIIAIAESM